MTIRAIILIMLVFGLGVWAQAPQKLPDSPAAPKGPEDISGMYSFLQDGEFVQITVEDQGKVSGFVSRFGDLPSDRGAFLDQFIKNGSLDGAKLAFVTDAVHGVWFEFRGVVARGTGKTLADEAYFVLRGTLTQNTIDAQKRTTARSREVQFKSFPQDVVVGRPKRD